MYKGIKNVYYNPAEKLVYLSTINGIKRFHISKFYPYFYSNISIEEARKLFKDSPFLRGIDGYSRSIFGDKLVKIKVSSPSKVVMFREILKNHGFKTFEADIKYESRVWIDLNLLSSYRAKLSDYKVVFLDIETLGIDSDEILSILYRAAREANLLL